MPPDRGRASRACASCRKQKTRCYEPGLPGKACLRCERLRQNCSLVEFERDEPEQAVPTSGTDARYVPFISIRICDCTSQQILKLTSSLDWNAWKEQWPLS